MEKKEFTQSKNGMKKNEIFWSNWHIPFTISLQLHSSILAVDSNSLYKGFSFLANILTPFLYLRLFIFSYDSVNLQPFAFRKKRKILLYPIIVFHWSLNDSEIPQVSRTLLDILANLNNLNLILPLISNSSSLFSNPF